MKYILQTTILIIIFAFSEKSVNKEIEMNSKQQTENQIQPNQYEELRKLALSTTAEQLGLSEIDDGKVYGIVSDLGMENGTATIVAFLTGDTSIYLSSGGGYIGAGNHKKVNKEIKRIVDQIQKFKREAKKIKNADLPSQNEVTFNFLTKNGLYQIKTNYEDLESQNSDYKVLFKEINKIISLIREKSGE